MIKKYNKKLVNLKMSPYICFIKSNNTLKKI